MGPVACPKTRQVPSSKHKAAVCPESEPVPITGSSFPVTLPLSPSVLLLKCQECGVNEDWDGTHSGYVICHRQSGDRGGPADHPAAMPQCHCLPKKGKLEMDLGLVRGLGQAGAGFGCHSFSPEKCQPICIRPNWGISQVNLPFHAQSQGFTFRCPAEQSTHRIHLIR